jgi:hypothetical protein
LHSQSPEKPADHKGNTVEVNAPGRDGHRVVLVRFQDLPQVKNLKQATLELTLPPTDTVYHPPTCDVSCLNFRPDWIAAEASYQFAAANMPWEAEALTGGERVLSRAPFDPILARKPELRWDVSDAVRRAQEKSERTIDLLIRVDDTGHYVSGRGYTFCDASHPDVKLRPRLRVIATEN